MPAAFDARDGDERGVGRDPERVAATSSPIRCSARTRAGSSTTTPPTKTLNCPGHFSRFDCEAAGQQVWGHATNNLPQFDLRVDDKGDIYAEGVDELIHGRLSNVLQG